MKTYILILLTIFLSPIAGKTQTEEDSPIDKNIGRIHRLEGLLTYESHEGQFFYAINLENPIKTTSQNGEPIISKQLQIAGLTPTQWTSYKTLIGTEVRIQGKLMEAETRYHFTPILVITHAINPIPNQPPLTEE